MALLPNLLPHFPHKMAFFGENINSAFEKMRKKINE
jgi:hypothetical protein